VTFFFVLINYILTPCMYMWHKGVILSEHQKWRWSNTGRENVYYEYEHSGHRQNGGQR